MLNKLSFRLNYSEIEERLDPIFYYKKSNLDIVNKTTLPVYKLKEVINMQRGRFGHRPRNDPSFYDGEYPFIQTGDVVRANFGSNISYSQTLNDKGLKTSRLFSEPVVVLTIAANIGYTAILNYPACFPDSLIGLTSKHDLLELEYINIYISLIRQYIEDLAPQAAQKNINYQQLSSIPIVVPAKNIQRKIIDVWNSAQNLENIKSKNAKEKLASIDTYLLEKLSIELPKEDYSFANRIFVRNFSEIVGEEWDPISISREKFKIEDGTYLNKKLFEIAHIQKGQSITSSDVVSGSYPVIAGGKTSPYTHNQYNYKGETITVSASGAYSGYVWYHDYPIFASDCSVIKVKDDLVLPLYLAELLKVKQKEIYYLQKGAGQPHVYPSDLAKLKIAIPSLRIQKEIISHINHIRDEAKKLEDEANQVLENAKQEIEKMILGETA